MDLDKHLEYSRLENDLQERDVSYRCDGCNCEIYQGNEYFLNDENFIFCEKCYDEIQSNQKKDARKVAGEEEWEN